LTGSAPSGPPLGAFLALAPNLGFFLGESATRPSSRVPLLSGSCPVSRLRYSPLSLSAFRPFLSRSSFLCAPRRAGVSECGFLFRYFLNAPGVSTGGARCGSRWGRARSRSRSQSPARLVRWRRLAGSSRLVWGKRVSIRRGDAPVVSLREDFGVWLASSPSRGSGWGVLSPRAPLRRGAPRGARVRGGLGMRRGRLAGPTRYGGGGCSPFSARLPRLRVAISALFRVVVRQSRVPRAGRARRNDPGSSRRRSPARPPRLERARRGSIAAGRREGVETRRRFGGPLPGGGVCWSAPRASSPASTSAPSPAFDLRVRSFSRPPP